MKDSAIQFPTTDRHRHRTKTGFHAIRGFPSVISAVDGTHVRIQTPSDDEEQCVNRKHFHSINVQASCDHRGLEDGILLGDSAYPCKPYMLTPYLHPDPDEATEIDKEHLTRMETTFMIINFHQTKPCMEQ
ncbi:HARB1-like protein [Mya arenaria]|uniref:HARB1-like protein n=1 Tax=Mya arenaria TaxID=6604 RepID=A0ABY7E6U1_MYAAR|nr:HARB1-like protein [Mya arenaria]